MIRLLVYVAILCVAPLPADAADAYTCALWAQAQTIYDFASTKDVDMLTADEGYILVRLSDRFTHCMLLPDAHPKIEVEGGIKSATDAYVRNVHAMLTARFAEVGTIPAAADPTPKDGGAEWRAQCEAEYSTWDEETGTVVRHGSPERVRCPCGGEVTCGG